MPNDSRIGEYYYWRIIMENTETKLEGLLKNLQEKSDKIEDLNRRINEEARVWAEERADRKRLGLVGDAEIIHYNEWMDKAGMPHLKVKMPNE